MATPNLTAEEIKLIRTSLHMTEREMAKQLDLTDRMQITQIETGRVRPNQQLYRKIMRLLLRNKPRSKTLKKIYDDVKMRKSTSI